MSTFLIVFYVVIVVSVIAGLALSVRAHRRGQRENATAGALLSLAIAALAVVPVML